MAVQIIHKNSSVAGKPVSSSQISYGELAINYNENGPFLQVRASDDEVWSVGGVTIGNDAPGSPLEGAFWYNEGTAQLFLFANGGWRSLGSGGSSGGSGAVDQLIGGNGIDINPTGGTGTVTLNVDHSNGLGISSGQLVVALEGGTDDGLEFDGGELKVSVATASALGGVKVGSGLSVTGTGEISVNAGAGGAVTGITGGDGIAVSGSAPSPVVAVDLDTDANRVGLEIDSDLLRARLASETQVGSIKVGDGLNISGGDTLNVDESIINGMQFEGSVDLRAAKSNTNPAPNANVKRGFTYVHENSTAGAMSATWQTATGESVSVSTGDLVIAQKDNPGDGEWTLITTSGTNFWNRDTSGDAFLEPTTAGDDIFTSGDLRIGDSATSPHFLVNGGSDGDLISDGSAIFNAGNGNKDFRVDGQTNDNVLFVDASAENVGIGTNAPAARLDVRTPSKTDCQIRLNEGGTANPFTISQTDTEARVQTNATQPLVIAGQAGSGTTSDIRFETRSTERVRIDADGKLLVGTTAARTAESNRLLQVESTNSSAGLSLTRNAQSVASATLGFIKTRGDQIGDNDIVEDNDQLGMIAFYGADGVDTNAQGARIFAFVDGTPASNEMPGCLSFQTNDGSANANPTERMRIRSDGNVSIGSSGTNFQRLSVYGTTGTGNGNTMEIIGARPEVSDAITSVIVYNSRPTFNFTGTQTSVFHYLADPQSITSGTITNQYGFRVQSSLTGATNNYGFYSDIDNAPSTNRWNFYADGTAPNFFKGPICKTSNAVLGNRVSTNTTAIILSSNTSDTSNGQIEIMGLDIDSSSKCAITFSASDSTDGSSASTAGSITIDQNGSGVKYNETSDYRLKNNIRALPQASELVKQLKPCSFDILGTNRRGFIAHELQQVEPQAVTGTKDETEAIGTLADYDGTVIKTEVTEPPAEELTYTEEVVVSPYVAPVEATYDEEGNQLTPAVEGQEAVTQTVTRTRTWTATGNRPVYQGIDQSKLIPLLTKALQEALERIEVLEAAAGGGGGDTASVKRSRKR